MDGHGETCDIFLNAVFDDCHRDGSGCTQKGDALVSTNSDVITNTEFLEPNDSQGKVNFLVLEPIPSPGLTRPYIPSFSLWNPTLMQPSPILLRFLVEFPQVS
jgi:hypothetical protein